MENNHSAPELSAPFRGILKKGFLAGVILSIASFGGLHAALYLKPDLFIDYINPIFNSDGSRDAYFYLHPFVLSFSLAVLWNRFKRFLPGGLMVKGIEFGLMYTLIALIPVMWITYSAIDVDIIMVSTWLLYGLCQASLCGVVFAFLDAL